MPCNFPNATKEPEKATVPINAPATANNCIPAFIGACFSNSTPAMAAAAPPPIPLYKAIICGISVIATRLPVYQATPPPIAIATNIST